MSEVQETQETITTPEATQEPTEMNAEQALYSEKPSEETVEASNEKAEDTQMSETSEEEVSETNQEDAEGEQKEWDYKLELEEESLLDNSVAEQLSALAKENNWTKEQASEVLNMQEEFAQNWVKQRVDAYEKEVAEWRETVLNDEVLGGDNIKKTAETCKKVVERYASPELINLLKESGYGDHPEFVKFVYNIGKVGHNDELVIPGASKGSKPIEDYFYGNAN